MLKKGDKLYVIVDSTVDSAIAQACHAAVQFVNDHPEIGHEWFQQSNYIAVLAVGSESELYDIVNKADIADLKISTFNEPDLDDRLTAIALEPSKRTSKICKNLKLA